MVIGTGLIATTFDSYRHAPAILIFASGVSNSKSSTAADFDRERQLLITAIQQHPQVRIVYFSTSSINDPDISHTPYIVHKMAMESLLRAEAKSYSIFRLSNLAGASANPYTILNFLYNAIHNGIPFDLWKNSERNIIDAEDVFRIADFILRHHLFENDTVNIANIHNYPVPYMVASIEKFCHKKAVFTEKEKGSTFEIDTTAIRDIIASLDIRFDEQYLPAVLKKYYS